MLWSTATCESGPKMWETMKGKSNNTYNMINKPSPPPDRAKMVHYYKSTNFEHFDDNSNQQQVIQNDAIDGNFNLAHAEPTIQQPTKPPAYRLFVSLFCRRGMCGRLRVRVHRCTCKTVIMAMITLHLVCKVGVIDHLLLFIVIFFCHMHAPNNEIS